jgi:hypothetical protein
MLYNKTKEHRSIVVTNPYNLVKQFFLKYAYYLDLKFPLAHLFVNDKGLQLFE